MIKCLFKYLKGYELYKTINNMEIFSAIKVCLQLNLIKTHVRLLSNEGNGKIKVICLLSRSVSCRKLTKICEFSSDNHYNAGLQ